MSAATDALAWLGGVTNRTLVLPLVVFFPTSRCNSRCQSCEWWQSDGRDELTLEEIDALAGALAGLGTRLVVFSGGEPLLRPDLFDAAEAFRRRGMTLHLLTSGLGLRPRAEEIAARFARVIVSLDAATDALYAEVRGIEALAAVEAGVARLRDLAPALPVTARATLHRTNFRQLPLLIAKARAMRFAGISFLAADVTSGAFGRSSSGAPRHLLLTREEIREFKALIDASVSEQQDAFASGFVLESPARLRRLPQYYAAMLGETDFPPTACDAPWVSAVIEATGDVRPCFFHPPVGNLRRVGLAALAREHLRAFRRGLDVSADDTCRRCVCSLKIDWSRTPWN
jgi:MoaA/NifB/PqqE/SkfB family radical SAM enzyme